MTDMQIGQDPHGAWLDHVLAKSREIAGASAAGIHRRGHRRGPAEFFGIYAQRCAAPIDMGVQIDEPRRDDPAADIVDIGFRPARQGVADLGDLAVRERDLGDAVYVLAGIDHAPAGQD